MNKRIYPEGVIILSRILLCSQEMNVNSIFGQMLAEIQGMISFSTPYWRERSRYYEKFHDSRPTSGKSHLVKTIAMCLKP
jgi:hypothetical protein